MIEYTIVALVLSILAYTVIDVHLTHQRWQKDVDYLRKVHANERQEWIFEREQLLDRIQSDSFREYKTQQLRIVKAQTGQADPAAQHQELL